jgi:hypothetical protein
MTKVYHITHIRNLKSIIERGGLLSDNAMDEENVRHVEIAYSNIKERRARTPVPLDPGGTLANYVPFYFAPRSPMLYALHTGFVEGYTEGQEPILHLVTTVDIVNEKKLPFVFTDGHAVMTFSDFYNRLDDLDKIDWEIMKATYWNDTPQDNDRSRRRQAEFLIHKFLPWNLIEGIGAINERTVERVNEILSSLREPPEVTIQKKWYY